MYYIKLAPVNLKEHYNSYETKEDILKLVSKWICFPLNEGDVWQTTSIGGPWKIILYIPIKELTYQICNVILEVMF